MYQIGICDDEVMILEVLSNMVANIMEELGEEVQIYQYNSGEKLLDAKQKLDVLFLDIEMPQLDGIETGRRYKMQCGDCKIIMATSMIERFKEAFKIQAYRFITKPFQIEEIKENLLDVIQSRIGMEKLLLYKNRNSYEVEQRAIKCIIAVDSYSEVWVGEERFRKDTSLSELEKELEEALFFRINRKCIVNFKWIDEYKSGEITMGRERVKVSVRRKKEFERKYVTYDVEYR